MQQAETAKLPQSELLPVRDALRVAERFEAATSSIQEALSAQPRSIAALKKAYKIGTDAGLPQQRMEDLCKALAEEEHLEAARLAIKDALAKDAFSHASDKDPKDALVELRTALEKGEASNLHDTELQPGRKAITDAENRASALASLDKAMDNAEKPDGLNMLRSAVDTGTKLSLPGEKLHKSAPKALQVSSCWC